MAAALATLAGCLSFDALSGGQVSDDDASGDATIVDDASAESASSADTSIGIDAGPAFDCNGIDAALCDDFNRDAAIPFSDLRWNDVDCQSGDVLTVNGTLVTTMQPSSNTHCVLNSKAIPNTGNFTLDFDMMFEVGDAGATTSSVVTVGVSFTLPAVNDAGILSVTYQLIVAPSGNGTWQILDYYPDAAASPSGTSSYTSYALAKAAPFVEHSTKCHIALQVTDSALNPSGTATSACDGANPITMTTAAHVGARGLGGTGELSIGYQDSNQGAQPSWSVTYDNLVYRAQ